MPQRPIFSLSVSMGCIILFLVFRIARNRVCPILALSASVFFAGAGHMQTSMRVPPCHLLALCRPPGFITVSVTLVKDPVSKPSHIQWTAQADTLYGLRPLKTTGKLLILLNGATHVSARYGDRFRISGELTCPTGKRNPGGFDYRAFLAGDHIYGILKPDRFAPIERLPGYGGRIWMRGMVYPVRRWMKQTLEKTSSGIARIMLETLLLGERGEMIPELRERFTSAGYVHILAVSGLHVGFAALVIRLLLGFFRLPRGLQSGLTGFGLLFYAALTEANPPVLRAAIMALCYIAGKAMQRNVSFYQVLGCSALVILALKPMDLFSTGFQLSYTAVFSIVFFHSKLSNVPLIIRIDAALKRWPPVQKQFQLFLASLAASIGTLPITARYFNQVPTLQVLTNMVAIPTVGVIVALGFVTLFSALVSHPVALSYSALNQRLISLLIVFTSRISALPFAQCIVAGMTLLQAAAYFSFIFFLLHFHIRRLRKKWLFLLLVALNASIWYAAATARGRRLVWTQIDVGQGDSCLLSLPHHRTLLIDTGNRTATYDAGRSVIAPYLRGHGMRKIDAVFITHPHDDHIGGIVYLMRHFTIGRLYLSLAPCTTPLCTEMKALAREKSIPMVYLSAPDTLRWDRIELHVLSPSLPLDEAHGPLSSLNNRSLVLRLLYGKTAFLFMGDAEIPVEKALPAAFPLRSQAIKIGHHGSKTATGEALLKRVRPGLAVISVGAGNRFKHPSPEVVDRLHRYSIPILRTDLKGAVIIESDGIRVVSVPWK